MNYAGLLLLGLLVVLFAGVLGIGGGLIIVPALLYLFKLPILDATGTSLAALVPPVGLLGALVYYQQGHVHIGYAAFIALGLLIGSYFGAKFVMDLSPAVVHRVYGGVLLVIAARMLIWAK
jgi:uncharacterized membrane protein YfcA